MAMQRVLVVEDTKEIAALVKFKLLSAGFEVTVAGGGSGPFQMRKGWGCCDRGSLHNRQRTGIACGKTRPGRHRAFHHDSDNRGGILMAVAWNAVAVFYDFFVLVYFFAIDLIYLALLVVALRAILNYVRKNRYANYEIILQSEFAVPISILAPAYNEEAGIIDSVQSLMMLDYAKFEVVVINDGSKDSTLQKLIDSFKLKSVTYDYPEPIPTKRVRGVYRSPLPAFNRLVVMDKENGGKADALNAGINAARYPLVCSIDADSLLEPDALLKVVKPFLEHPREMVAVGG